MTPMPDAVRAVFDGYPAAISDALLPARDLLFDTAKAHSVGGVEETLRWGQPAYLTATGTTVRLAPDKNRPAMMVHCQTDLIETFRAEHPQAFDYSGTRALYLDTGYDTDALALFIRRALTYRHAKRKAQA